MAAQARSASQLPTTRVQSLQSVLILKKRLNVQAMCYQLGTNRRGAMLRVTIILVLLSHRIGTSVVTDRPSFADRLDKIYEKLEKFTIAPTTQEKSPREKLYEKLDKLKSLTPQRVDFSDDDEELLSAVQMWGTLSAEDFYGVVKDLQGVREADDEKSARNDGEYGDSEWSEEVSDFRKLNTENHSILVIIEIVQIQLSRCIRPTYNRKPYLCTCVTVLQ